MKLPKIETLYYTIIPILLGLILGSYNTFPWENVTITITILLALGCAGLVAVGLNKKDMFDKDKEHSKKLDLVFTIAFWLLIIFGMLSFYLWSTLF